MAEKKPSAVLSKSASERALELKADNAKMPQILDTLKKEGYKTKFGRPLKATNVYAYFHKGLPKTRGLKKSTDSLVSAKIDAINAITSVKSMADDQRLEIIKKIVS